MLICLIIFSGKLYYALSLISEGGNWMCLQVQTSADGTFQAFIIVIALTPTDKSFVQKVLVASQSNKRLKKKKKYSVGLSLQHYRFREHFPFLLTVAKWENIWIFISCRLLLLVQEKWLCHKNQQNFSCCLHFLLSQNGEVFIKSM